jgi:antitoxin component of MazEF toxin-antitoxin module
MSTVFESKVRPIGSSLGVIIPSEIITQQRLSPGNKVEVAILKRDFRLIRKLMGSMKGAKPFVRDRQDRF